MNTTQTNQAGERTQERKYLHFPNESVKSQAEEIISVLDSSAPFDTTFLFMEEGCESVGQDTPLAKAIQRAMETAFNRWEESWIRPRAQEIVFRLTK